MLSINQFCHDCMSHFIIALAATKYMGFKNVYGWLSHCNVDTSGSCTSMVAELGPSRGSLSFSSPWREGLTTSTSSMWTTTKIPWKNTERTALTIQFISGWFVLQPHPWFWFNSANVQARSLSGGTLDRGVPRLMLALSTFKLIDWWMMQSSWDLRFDWDLSLTDRMLKFKVTCTWDVSDLSRLRSSTFPKWKQLWWFPDAAPDWHLSLGLVETFTLLAPPVETHSKKFSKMIWRACRRCPQRTNMPWCRALDWKMMCEPPLQPKVSCWQICQWLNGLYLQMTDGLYLSMTDRLYLSMTWWLYLSMTADSLTAD